MLRFFATATYFLGFVAAIMLLIGGADTSAPRAAAMAAMACATIIIPYCITKILWMSRQTENHQQMMKQLHRMNTVLENLQLPEDVRNKQEQTG